MDLSHTRPTTDSEITSSHEVYRSITIDYSFLPDGLYLLRKALAHFYSELGNTGHISYDNGLIEWPDTPDLNRAAVDSITEEMIIQRMYEEKIIHDSTQYQTKRRSEYPKTDALIIALWEKVMEDNSLSADELQELRVAIKEKYPKP